MTPPRSISRCKVRGWLEASYEAVRAEPHLYDRSVPGLLLDLLMKLDFGSAREGGRRMSKPKSPEQLVTSVRDQRDAVTSAASALQDSVENLLALITGLSAERHALKAALRKALDALDPAHPVHLELRALVRPREAP